MICDLAETYRIYDYQRLPVKYLAILVAGLRVDSRVECKRMGIKAPLSTVYIADLCDYMEIYVRALSGQDCKANRKERLMVDYNPESSKQGGMEIDEFNALRNRILED